MLALYRKSAVWPLLVLLVAAAPAVAAPDDPPCIADWSDAAPIVARERLASVRNIQDLARNRYSGDLVRITLCREDSRFVYRIILRDLRGRISSLTLDARQPFAGPEDR